MNTVTSKNALQYVIEEGISAKRQMELEDLYESLNATSLYVDLHYPKHEVSSFVMYKDQTAEPRDIIIFEKERRTINILNELVDFDPEVLAFFCDKIFERYPGVNKVSCYNLYTKPDIPKYATFTYGTSCDFIIDLPDSIDTYKASLGKNLRRNLNGSTNRVHRDHPSIRFDFLEKEAITEEVIDQAMHFTALRMEGKGKHSLLNKQMRNLILQKAKAYGLVTRIFIEDQIAAVNIGFLVGKHYYFDIITHDPQYNYYRLGQLNLFYLIKIFLGTGGEKFHFLWGDYWYKYKFNANKHILYGFKIVRHPKQVKWLRLRNKLDKGILFLENLTFEKVKNYLKARFWTKKGSDSKPDSNL